MKIEILEFIEGAAGAKGFTVIIDVFRAFTVACYAHDAGASKIIATGDTEKAFELKRLYRNAILAGERNERKIDGFDLGNSPTEIIKTNISGKVFIHTTTAGTNGLVNAGASDHLITGSLVNAGAVARYIKMINPPKVSLVAMGYRAKESAEEDLLCAEYIRAELQGEKANFDKRISEMISGSGKRFFRPGNLDFSPPTDFFLCTMTNRFSFILKAVKRSDGNIELEPVEV